MWKLLGFSWSLALCAGAALIRSGLVQKAWPGADRLLAWEPAHVLGHLVLYGSFAAFLSTRMGPARVLTLTLAVGVAQEWVQVTGRRSFGPAEFFDLAVDLTAACLVVVGSAVRTGTPARVTPG